MKIKKIASICKRSKHVVLYECKESGGSVTQWLSDGRALYLLNGLPRLDQESIYTIFDIPLKERSKWMFRKEQIPQGISVADIDTGESLLERTGLQFSFNERNIQPLKSDSGLLFLDTDYLAPLDDDEGMVRLYERGGAEKCIVVKLGFMIKAVILPCNVINSGFAKEIGMLYAQCSIQLMKNSGLQASSDSGNSGD